jgi:phosphoglycolate phosphatase-like HAD superfamily hydrolase
MRAAGHRAHTIRNVIWDVDGTLFDTYPAIARAFRAALNELGADEPAERIVELARESLGACLATLAADHGLDPASFDEAFGRHYERIEAADQPPFPGVTDVCRGVVRLGGRNVIVTHRGPRGTAELLAAANLAPYIADCITRADGFPRKPDPAAFDAIIERNGLARDETLAIGDREIDVQAGRAAGVMTCLFGPIKASLEADLVIDDFRELARLLAEPDQ